MRESEGKGRQESQKVSDTVKKKNKLQTGCNDYLHFLD